MLYAAAPAEFHICSGWLLTSKTDESAPSPVNHIELKYPDVTMITGAGTLENPHKPTL